MKRSLIFGLARQNAGLELSQVTQEHPFKHWYSQRGYTVGNLCLHSIQILPFRPGMLCKMDYWFIPLTSKPFILSSFYLRTQIVFVNQLKCNKIQRIIVILCTLYGRRIKFAVPVTTVSSRYTVKGEQDHKKLDFFLFFHLENLILLTG